MGWCEEGGHLSRVLRISNIAFNSDTVPATNICSMLKLLVGQHRHTYKLTSQHCDKTKIVTRPNRKLEQTKATSRTSVNPATICLENVYE